MPNLFWCLLLFRSLRYLASALIKSTASANPASRTHDASDGHLGNPETVESARPNTVSEKDEPTPPLEAGREGGNAAAVPPPAAGIRRLLLTGNRLGEAGARALASALKKDLSLEVLDLTRCDGRCAGSAFLFFAVLLKVVVA